MIQAAAFVRAVAKITLWLFVALLSSAVLWFAANRLLDESPDPSREGFLVSSQDLIPNERNIAVGILGLTAPEGLDFVQYGSRVKALYASNAPQGEIQEMVRGPKTLRPTVDSDQVTCWLDPGDPIFKEWKNCLPFEQAPKVLEQNKELLKRYKALYRLGSYSSLDIYYNNAYFTVPKLLAAEMHLSLRGRSYGVAYRKWRDQMVFVKGKLRGPDTWVGKAIGLVDFGMAFSFLEPLLVANPQVAKVHFAELSEILRPEGMDAFNPEGIVRAEYSILKKSLQFPPQENPERPVDRLHWLTFHLGQPNRILNRYYAFAREYTPSLRLPWDQIDKESDRLREKYVYSSNWDAVIDPFGTLFLGEYIKGQLKAREMRRQMYISDGRLRLATLLVRIINKNVSDDDIPRFMASAGPELYDPFSGNPMRWDQKNRRLAFPDPDDRCGFYAYLRVPKSAQSGKASQPNIQAGAC